jgi:hypothetical protein
MGIPFGKSSYQDTFIKQNWQENCDPFSEENRAFCMSHSH